jgi:hypothetical protein
VNTVPFRELPATAKVAVGVAFYNAWVSLEEFVIDRIGLWRHMPFYVKGGACLWDLAVGLVIVLGLWRLSRQGEGRRA